MSSLVSLCSSLSGTAAACRSCYSSFWKKSCESCQFPSILVDLLSNAAVIRLSPLLAHSGQDYCMRRGGLWGTLCVVVYRLLWMFIAHEGNPAVGPRVSPPYRLMLGQIIWSFTTFTSAWLFLPPGTCKRVLAAHARTHASKATRHAPTPTHPASQQRPQPWAAAGDISTNPAAGVRLCSWLSCCFFFLLFIREGRARAGRCHGSRFWHQSFTSAMASFLSLSSQSWFPFTSPYHFQWFDDFHFFFPPTTTLWALCLFGEVPLAVPFVRKPLRRGSIKAVLIYCNEVGPRTPAQVAALTSLWSFN